MSGQIQEQIKALVESDRVVVFMKGSRHFPQCGFSATVVQILDQLVKGYKTVNVLQDADVRQGVKDYASWPTIPQVYVDGNFVGGCDIVRDMFQNGELHQLLGVEQAEVPEPKIELTEAARTAVLEAAEGEAALVRLEISPDFNYGLSIDAARSGDFSIALEGGLTLLVDRASASRADGIRIDFVSEAGSGFKIDNPNEPASVVQLAPAALKEMMDAGEAFELIDVRGDDERAIARIETAQPFDDQARERLEQMDKDTVLVFQCHHGGRSQAAAQHYLQQGFTRVNNLVGGIDAWSAEIDPSIKRY